MVFLVLLSVLLILVPLLKFQIQVIIIILVPLLVGLDKMCVDTGNKVIAHMDNHVDIYMKVARNIFL